MPILQADIDLDFGNRDQLLSCIAYTPATIVDKIGNISRHNSGIYITAIPQDVLTGMSSIDYKKAEELGYVKLDILNNHLYSQIKSQEYMDELLDRPIHWNRLLDAEFVKHLIHIGNYADMIKKLAEPIDSIEKLSMFLAIIRPGKKYLQGLPWDIIEKSVWRKEESDEYSFKRAHAISYSIAITLQIRLLEDNGF